MINITPDPIAIHLGPLPVYWYGVAYAVGLAVSYLVLVRQARRFGQDPEIIGNALIVIAVAALIGGRLYHVIDQWSLYQNDPLKIILPPYSGLGVYGGLITGVIAFIALVRYHRVNPWVWADIVAPALFTMQAIGRWGNFFNQELYGPPTKLPWGIAIDCAHRIGDHGLAQYACATFPEATTGFHPLFLYESISGVVGALFLIWLSRRRPYPLRPGDQALIFFIWYPVVRFLLENLRTGNWVVGGIPTAQVMSILFALSAFLILLYRHRRRVDDRSPAGGSDDIDDIDDIDEPEDIDEVEPGTAAAGTTETGTADAGSTDAGATDADEDRMTDDGGPDTAPPRATD
jgi:phosphatidylglycerol:prolipoprotein diacylglycerol transferase